MKHIQNIDDVIAFALVNKTTLEVCVNVHGSLMARWRRAVEERNISTLCELGSLRIIQKYINASERLDWNRGLRGACYGGHMALALLMIEKGATDWNWGLRGACEGGHMALAQLMFEKGATDLNWGLWGACEGGQMELAQLMIERGAQHIGCEKCKRLRLQLQPT